MIALETNTIKDENEIIKWVGSTDTVKYGYRPEIYHDMPVKEAFELSAGWVFVELAKKIGKDTYRKHLAESMETIIYPKLKPIFGILETLQFRLKIRSNL